MKRTATFHNNNSSSSPTTTTPNTLDSSTTPTTPSNDGQSGRESSGSKIVKRVVKRQITNNSTTTNNNPSNSTSLLSSSLQQGSSSTIPIGGSVNSNHHHDNSTSSSPPSAISRSWHHSRKTKLSSSSNIVGSVGNNGEFSPSSPTISSSFNNNSFSPNYNNNNSPSSSLPHSNSFQSKLSFKKSNTIKNKASPTNGVDQQQSSTSIGGGNGRITSPGFYREGDLDEGDVLFARKTEGSERSSNAQSSDTNDEGTTDDDEENGGRRAQDQSEGSWDRSAPFRVHQDSSSTRKKTNYQPPALLNRKIIPPSELYGASLAASIMDNSSLMNASVGSMEGKMVEEAVESDPESFSSGEESSYSHNNFTEELSNSQLQQLSMKHSPSSPILASSPRTLDIPLNSPLSSSPMQKIAMTHSKSSSDINTARSNQHTKGMYYRMMTGGNHTQRKKQYRKLVTKKNIFGLPVTFSKPAPVTTTDYQDEEYVKEMTTTKDKNKKPVVNSQLKKIDDSQDKLEDVQDKLALFHKIQYAPEDMPLSPGRSFLDTTPRKIEKPEKKDDKKQKQEVQTPTTPKPANAPTVKKHFYKVNTGTCTSIPSTVPLNTDNIDKKQFELVYWSTYKDLAEDEYLIEKFFVSNFSAMDLLYKLFYNNPDDTNRKRKFKELYNGHLITEQMEQLRDIFKQVSKIRMCTLVKKRDERLENNQKLHEEKIMQDYDSSSSDDDVDLVINEKGEIDNVFSMKNLMNNFDQNILAEINKTSKTSRNQRNITINSETLTSEISKSSHLTLKDLENEERFNISAKITGDTKIEFYTIRNWLTKILACSITRKKREMSTILPIQPREEREERIESFSASPVTATLLNIASERNEWANEETYTYTNTNTNTNTNTDSDYSDPNHLQRWKRKSVLRKGPLENNTPKLEMQPTELLDYMMALSCSASTLFDTLDEWEVRIHALFAFLETLTLQTPHQINCILVFLGDLILYNQSLMSSEFIHECLIPYLGTILKKPESIPFVDLFLKRITERSQLLYIRDQAQRTINLTFDNFSSSANEPNFLVISSFQLSIQLTLIEFDLFSMMEPYEFYSSYWLSKNRFKVKTRDPSANLSLFINFYNTVSLWVTETILSYSDIKDRHKALCRFISLAWGCYSVRNYNGCFEIISGLYSNEVYRLSKTWSMLSEEYLKRAQTLIDLTSVANNYRNYREELKTAKKPCIPNIAVHLKDLAAVDDSQEDERKLTEEEMRLLAENDEFCQQVFIGRTLDEDIEYNFSKRRLQSTLICQLLRYQKTSYPFKANDTLKHFIWRNLLRINEDIRRQMEDKKITIEKYIQERKRQFLVKSKQLEPKSTR